MGLTAGDIVLLHSSLSSLGTVDEGADSVIGAFLDVVGESGTLVVPTFGKLGIVTDVVKEHPSAISSVHPLASVAAIGADAKEICRDHWKAELAHAEDTPYTRIAEKGGYVCLLGVDQDRNTTLHTVEELLRLPYLKTTDVKTFATPEGEVSKSWPFFPGPHRNFIGLDRILRESGKMKIARIGKAVTRLIKSQDLIDVALQAGKEDPAFVLCDNPNCMDCISQKADLRRDRFSREDFTLVASAGLAGRYAEEIADNCHAAGIDAVELDFLRRRPINMLEQKAIAEAISRLRDEKIDVVSLRSWTAALDLESLIKLAKENQIRRLVIPLSHRASEQARAVGMTEAASSGLSEENKHRDGASTVDEKITISFFNTDLDSGQCSAILLDMKEQGIQAGFTFNGANFARSGELPFLSSYKKKLRRFIDQLDVVDGTYEGVPTPLAGGNAEMKEMISILRCASFGGYMTLSAGNRHVGTLSDAVQRFENLLDTM